MKALCRQEQLDVSSGERERERKKSTGIQLEIKPGTFLLLVGCSYYWHFYFATINTNEFKDHL